MNRYYSDREKCYKCYRPKSSCMCEYINSINTNTKFIILMHPKEFKKVKNNTGHFVHQSLSNSELFVGIDFSDNDAINDIIATHESYILFPSVDAVNLTEENPKSKVDSTKKIAIFLIDSTWACTKKIFTLSKNLNTLKHMSFVSDRVSKYKIKAQPELNYLSTIESTHVVLELLNRWNIENIDEQAMAEFLNPFYKMIEYQLRCIENPQSNAIRFKSHKNNKN